MRFEGLRDQPACLIEALGVPADARHEASSIIKPALAASTGYKGERLVEANGDIGC